MAKKLDHICFGCTNYDGGKCSLYLSATANDPDNPITECTHYNPQSEPAAPAESAPKE